MRLPPDLVTVVLMMSMGTRGGPGPARLVARGWPADTPAAVILGAATPQAWTWKGPLERAGRGRGARRPRRAARHHRDRTRRRPAADARRRRTSLSISIPSAWLRPPPPARPRPSEDRPMSAAPRPRIRHPRPGPAVVCQRRGHRRVRRRARPVRARRDHAGAVARLPPRPRHLRPAPARRRADDPGEDPAGHADGGPARRAGRRRRALLARLRSHHHPPERPDPLRQAARRRAGDAAARRGRPHHPRGVRQLGAQHHRLPVRRRRRRRAVRRDPLRRSADPLPAAAPAERGAAAQVQDRVRRLHPRSHQADHQRHRLAGAGAGRPARLPGLRRRRHLDDDRRRAGAGRLHAGRGPAARRRGGRPRVPRARRLPAPAAQPDEVPDQGDGLGRVPRRLRGGAGAGAGRRRARPRLRRRAAGRRAGAGVGAGSRRRRCDEIAARVARAAAALHGPGIHPEPRPAAGRQRLRPLAAHQRPPAEAGGLRLARW